MVALSRPGVASSRIRRASALDHGWVTEVGAAAFAHLGDYREVLPAWLAQPNVATWVDDPAPRRGFTMIAFYRDERSTAQVADLLAITVEPAWRGHGLGRALLAHAIAVVRAAGAAAPLRELRLCVAEDNHQAQAMYARAGFVHVEVDVGRYAAGQRALRMALAL